MSNCIGSADSLPARRHGIYSILCALAPFAFILCPIGLAFAASDDSEPPVSSLASADELEEVVVTGRKRSERLMDVPESITAITEASMAANGIQTVDDLARQTPNLQLSMRQDLTPNVVIRGVGAYGIVTGVGFTLDDVPNYTDQVIRIEDLQSVEILKGPQGTLYGGSAIGGEIVYHSKLPSMDWSGESSIEVGNYNTINVYAGQNIPLIQDTLALRLSAYDVKSDGYITNRDLGINGDPVTDYAIKAAFLYKPTSELTALLTLRHSYLQDGANEYEPTNHVTDLSYDVALFEPTYNKRWTNGVTLKLDDAIGPYTLTSISSYTRAQYALNQDSLNTPPGVQSLFTTPPVLGLIKETGPGNRPTHVGSQELRIASPTGGPIDWIAGLYAATIQNILLNQIETAFYPPPADTYVANDFFDRRTDFAAFGTLNYHIGRVTVGAGARLERSTAEAHAYVTGGPPNQYSSVASKAFLPKFSLSYNLSHDAMIYGNVALGLQPGDINVSSYLATPFPAEKATSYEIGAKTQLFDRSVEANLAAFYIDHTHHQYQTNVYVPPPGPGLIGVIDDVGKSRTYGLEGDLTWRVIRDVTFTASAGYLNARWGPGAHVLSGNGSIQPLTGLSIPNAPSATARLGLDYSHDITPKYRFEAHLNGDYTDSFWWDLPNTPNTENPAYWLTNAGVGIGSVSDSWKLSLHGTNVFSTKFWTEYYPLIFGGGPGFVGGGTDLASPAAPAQVFLSLVLKY